jgi:glycosyltransferase involved in cell wall biosynthesis
MGRQAAGEGFLKALVEYGRGPNLYCYTDSQQVFTAFQRQVQPWLRPGQTPQAVPPGQLGPLQAIGCLYRPDPGIAQQAWERRFLGDRAYSLCGVTHTIASKSVMEMLGQLVTAPVYPWDAIICTSMAVRKMVEQMTEDWLSFLGQRLNAAPNIELTLPVIPLGVDYSTFATRGANREARAKLRADLGIGPEDLVVLYVGRLIFHAKAHPLPMFLALEQAAEATETPVHVLQAGWFEDTQQAEEFQSLVEHLNHRVTVHTLDGRLPQVREQVWAAADVFVSLADNIQETFGLTPIEAMAAGLPVVVSDWNGYQESVRDGVEGFRIPTLIPPPGAGQDLAYDFWSDRLNYSTYIGHACLMTAVEVEACTQAFIQLFQDADLRRQMGEAGQARAQERYDWRVVIAAYEDLWASLSERRQAASDPPRASGSQGNPLCDDPFRRFAHYATSALQADHRLGLGSMASADRYAWFATQRMTRLGQHLRSDSDTLNAVIQAIEAESALTVETLLERFGGGNGRSQLILWRSLVYLIKLDVLRRL